MNNSVIISFFVKFFQCIMNFFNNSGFYALQKNVTKLWLRISRKSFFVDWFKTYPQAKEEYSLLYRAYCGVFDFFAKIVLAVSDFLKKTCVYIS